MKQRITYVVKNPDDFSPEQLSVGRDGETASFSLKGVNAAKEHRITIGLNELSGELREALQPWHDIHIRLTSENQYTSVPPFTSRTSPGLHVLFTPLDDHSDADICPLIHRLYSDSPKPPKCSSSEAAIESQLADRVAGRHYWSDMPLNDLNPLVPNLSILPQKIQDILPEGILHADYVDVDYTSQAVVLTAHWSKAADEGWTETITTPDSESTIEIGVLSHEPNSDPEDIQFGGFLTVLGQDDKPRPTRFQTPTRHYPLLIPETYSPTKTPKPLPLHFTAHINPEGLHPTLALTFPHAHLAPPAPTCRLYAHLTLPSAFFLDRYQFTDALFLASHKLVSLGSLTGATDLEAPEWTTTQWGSSALLELAVPATDNTDTNWTATIPMHLRYQAASHERWWPASADYSTRVSLPWPAVFWACDAEASEGEMAGNPFHRGHLGYDNMFPAQTRFMHVEPRGGKMVEEVRVPTLQWEDARWVEIGTIGVVAAAFVGLCWVLFRGGQKTREKTREKTQ